MWSQIQQQLTIFQDARVETDDDDASCVKSMIPYRCVGFRGACLYFGVKVTEGNNDVGVLMRGDDGLELFIKSVLFLCEDAGRLERPHR